MKRVLLIVAALACAVAGVGACLHANAPDGLILCSSVPGRECPEGYYCEPLSQSCYHLGDWIDMAGTYPPGTDLSYPQLPPFVQDLSGQVHDMANAPQSD